MKRHMARLPLLLALLLVGPTALAQPPLESLAAWAVWHETAPQSPLLPRASFMPDPAPIVPALAPDGRYLVYGVRDGMRTSLRLLDTRAMETRELLRSDRL